MKPMLFSTEMIKAILDGRKTMTRRVVKNITGYLNCDCDGKFTYDAMAEAFYCEGCGYPLMADKAIFLKPLHKPGDILWVRETFFCEPCMTDCDGREDVDECAFNRVGDKCYGYKAQYDVPTTDIKWKPSIHMPKEAARIFLRVTGVRIERLREITSDDCFAEGVGETEFYNEAEHYAIGGSPLQGGSVERCAFVGLWGSTIKKQDLDKYSWDTNPWVWVYEFERISKEETE